MTENKTGQKTGQQSGTKKAARFFAGLVLGLLLFVGVAYAADILLNKDDVPRGATVGGVEIGGLSKTAAVEKLEAELGGRVQQSVAVNAENADLSAKFVPAEVGIQPNWEATVEGAGAQAYNPITRLKSLFRTYEVPAATDVDEAVFNPAMEAIGEELGVAAVDGGVNVVGGTVNIDPQPSTGWNVDPQDLSANVLEQWLQPEGVSVEATEFDPAIGEDAVKEVAEGAAKNAVSMPLTVQGRDGIDGVIEPEQMAEVLSFAPEGDHLKAVVDVDQAREILNATLQETEQPKRNATILADGSIRAHSDGITLDWDATLDGLEERIVSADRADHVFEAVYEDDPSTFTTEMAQNATFDEVVGEFTTSGYSQASGVNIARTAQIVNGAIVAPGDTFSLNGYTGPRGTAQGFVESGIILNGHADKAVGGGISQFATTLYNAAYFAGMEDVAHTPHSYYISRYPAGREATVYEGAIDLQFKNTSQYPVRIVAFMGDNSVTVRLMGVKTVQVESVSGGRWNYTDPQPITIDDADCVPSSGAPGFTTTDTRIIRDLSGNELSRETQTTVYDPSPIIRCA